MEKDLFCRSFIAPDPFKIWVFFKVDSQKLTSFVSTDMIRL
jgi:hypothetical protein